MERLERVFNLMCQDQQSMANIEQVIIKTIESMDFDETSDVCVRLTWELARGDEPMEVDQLADKFVATYQSSNELFNLFLTGIAKAGINAMIDDDRLTLYRRKSNGVYAVGRKNEN